MTIFLPILLFTDALQAQSTLTPAPPPYDPVIVAKRTAHPEGLAFFANSDAHQDVEKAIIIAKAEGKIAVIIMGANWCHDSVSLAGWLDTPRFMNMTHGRYVFVFVDVGRPQEGHGRNLDIAQRFGIDKVKHTPLVLMVSGEGVRLNSKKDAISWRNAASRREDAIFAYFNDFRPTQK